MASGMTPPTTATLSHHLTANAQGNNDKAAEGYMLLNVAADLKRKGLGARTAAKFAGFLLPHLRPGMRLLDCGCGPGSITLGLAAGVAPGEAVGIDFDPDSIQIARALAAEQPIANVRFEVADLYALPFPDASFDVAFTHAVLLHLREPTRALKEIKRILKPGGLIGIRNDDKDGLLIAPPNPLLMRKWELMAQLIERNGGRARDAKRSRAWLREAGFVRTEASASYETYGTPAETAWWGEICVAVVRSLEQQFLDVGLADQETIEQICAVCGAWGADPDAFFAKAWCEAIGWVA
jgi:ubiquinone/menaquinone biosynthesis C-methylase UbiE